jgi:hypothetical protein
MKKKFRLTKDSLARMCAGAGMQPEIRTHYRHFDVFIADGFTAHPEVTLRRFGVGPGDFPFGAFVTMWSVAKGEDHIEVASILTEDAFKGHGEQAKRDRLKAALYKAGEFIAKRQRLSRSGNLLNA